MKRVIQQLIVATICVVFGIGIFALGENYELIKIILEMSGIILWVILLLLFLSWAIIEEEDDATATDTQNQ